MARPNPAARHVLLDATQHLMATKGYAATTIDDICRAARATKGMFFHYFETKEAIAAAALERFIRTGTEIQRGAPSRRDPDPLKRFEGHIEYTIGLISDPVNQACLVGMFVQELAETHPELRAICQRALAETTRDLKTMLDEARAKYAPRTRTDTQSLAELFLVIFEGALILCKAKNDIAPLRASLRHYKHYVRKLLGRDDAR